MRIVREVCKKPLILLHPYVREWDDRKREFVRREPTRKLLPHVVAVKKIREGLLAGCQMPDVLADAHGEIHKPSAWSTTIPSDN